MTGPEKSPSSRLRAAWRRLRPPQPPSNISNRDSVLRSLNAARHTSLTLVIAPPGFGKTTVLAQWCQQLGRQDIVTAWYSGSAPEQDPIAFLAMLARSLAGAGLDCPAEPDILGDMPVEVLLDTIMLALDRWRGALVIVIDDYERIDCAPVAELVETIVQNIPPNIHLVIAGRIKPRLPYSAWRLQGLTRVIEAADLALSRADIANALNMSADMSEVDTLFEMTRGWPVAVQLYELWRAHGDDEADMGYFSGKLEEVADYFAQRVFDTLPEQCRDLLVELSVLDEIEVAAADHIRGKDDSGRLLAEGERHLGALLARADTGGVVAYRLHPLLQSYAFAELEKNSALLSSVRLAAAEWLWNNQHYPESVRLQMQAGDQNGCLKRLAKLEFFKLFLNYGSAELRLITRELPQAMIDRSPRVRLILSLIHFKEGLFVESRAMLAAIREETQNFRIDPDGDPQSLEIEGNSLEMMFDTYMRGMPDGCEETCRHIIAMAHDMPLIWAWCHNILLVVNQFRGELDAAERDLHAAATVYDSIRMTSFASQHLEMHRILIALARGVLHQAAKMAGGLVRHPNQVPSGVKDPGLQLMGKLATAIVDYYQHCRLGAADMVAVALKQFGVGEAWFDHYAFGWPVMLDAAWRRHGVEGVMEQLDRHRAQMRQRGVTAFEPLLDALEVFYLERSGERELACGRVEDAGLRRLAAGETPEAGWQACEYARQALGQVALSDGDTGMARELGEAMVASGASCGRISGEIKGHLLVALSLEREGRRAGAIGSTRSALRLALPEQWLMPFAQCGPDLLPVLQQAQSEDLLSAERLFVDRIINALSGQQDIADPSALSEREAEIIAHIAEGASNKLVARRLGISDNTVKFHLKKIYAKLGVSTRQAAVAKALDEAGS